MEANAYSIVFEPVETKKASELIFDQIKEMIIDGRLKPGERLPSERTLMDMMGKSRPTIREALRMLESNGLIRTSHGKSGAEVVSLTDSCLTKPLTNMINLNQISYSDLAETRLLIEDRAVEVACEKRTEDDLRTMREYISRARANRDNIDEFLKCDLLFHEAMCNASRNKFATMIDNVCHEMVEDILKGSYQLKSTKDKQDAMIDEILFYHAKLVESIEARNVEDARKYLNTHLDSFMAACRRVSFSKDK